MPTACLLGGRTGVTAEACHHLLSVPAAPCGGRTPFTSYAHRRRFLPLLGATRLLNGSLAGDQAHLTVAPTKSASQLSVVSSSRSARCVPYLQVVRGAVGLQRAHAGNGTPRPVSLVRQSTTAAPAGSSPCSTYFHNAMSSFRAKATMPNFFCRLPPAPKRLCHQT